MEANDEFTVSTLYTQARIPNLPEFENRYAAALFCSVAKNLSDIVERVEFKVSET